MRCTTALSVAVDSSRSFLVGARRINTVAPLCNAMKLSVAAALAVALHSVAPALADYTSSDKVVILTDSNFKSQVLESDDVWRVEFCARWCGHCKNLEPEWKKAAKQMASTAGVKFGAVDATEHAALAQQYSVQGYPTIKIFGTDKKKPKDYRGG